MEIEALTAELRTEFKNDIEALEQAAYERGKAEGAAAERQRIKGVRDSVLPGHEALIEQLMWDGKTTPAEAAQFVLNAEREKRARALADLKAEAPAPVPHAEAPEGDDIPKIQAVATVEQARKVGLIR
jgi:hypothetical protein